MGVWTLIRENGSAFHPVTKTISGVHVIRFEAALDDFIGFCKSVMRFPFNRFDTAAAAHPFDVIIAHQPLNYCFLSGAGRIKNVPLIYNFHSPWHQEYLLMREKVPQTIKMLPAMARKYLERFCIRKAGKIMVLSEYMQHKLQRIHATASERILFNPGGVDTTRFKPVEDRAQLKYKLGLPQDTVHLLTVRNLEPRMGLDRLLQCMAIVKRKCLPVHLVLAGDGIEKNRLQKLVDHLDLSRHVRMEGFIDAERLPDYYAAADFFILPTRALEGFGLVTPESLACGTPVLGTPVGGTLEILKKLNSDLLFKDASPLAMADGIQRILKKYFADQPKYTTLRRQCRMSAEKNYPWERHNQQLADAVRKIVRVKTSQSGHRA